MATYQNTTASSCSNNISNNKDDNMCSFSTINSLCDDWNRALIYDKGDKEPTVCDYNLIGNKIKTKNNLYTCNKYNLLEPVPNGTPNEIKTQCNGSNNTSGPSWDFCNPLSSPSKEGFDPKINNQTEYNTIQNNKINIQNKYLEDVQTEIASKDAVLDIYRDTNKKSIKTVKVLKIFFIFLFIFFIALMAHAYRKIDNIILGLTFITLTVSYIYYLIWTFKTDNIPNMVKYDTDNIKNAFVPDNEKSDCKKKDVNGNCIDNNSEYSTNKYIEDNCDCPPGSEEEDGGGDIPTCKSVETNKGNFYYDSSAPKQRLYPKVRKEDSTYLEYIEWDKNNGSDELPWNRNNGEYRKFADPNYKLSTNRNVEHDNQFWSVEEEEEKSWTIDL